MYWLQKWDMEDHIWTLKHVRLVIPQMNLFKNLEPMNFVEPQLISSLKNQIHEVIIGFLKQLERPFNLKEKWPTNSCDSWYFKKLSLAIA
jgi:hypothetical protein